MCGHPTKRWRDGTEGSEPERARWRGSCWRRARAWTSKTKNGWTALKVASFAEHCEVVVLEKGASMDIQTEGGGDELVRL